LCQELATQLVKIKPELDGAGVRLVAVGIGTPERGPEFCQHVGFPPENLFTDPESLAYERIGLYKSVARTFFNPATPYAMLARFQKDGAQDLRDVLGRWKIWIPPKQDQAFQQGGTFILDGTTTVFEHFDQSTGDHPDLDTVLDVARDLKSAP